MAAEFHVTEENSGLRERVLDEIRQAAIAYGVEKVILFGSRARGDFQRTSDIDLAVFGGRIAEFSLAVDEETSTLLKYDFVDLQRPVQEELLASIKREGKLIYEKAR